MKKIVKSLFVSMAVAFGVFFQSCSDDDSFSVGDIAVDWATVHAHGTHTYSLTGDNWGTMWPAASAVVYTPVDGERVMSVFNPLYRDYQGYDYAIKVESMQRILTKQVETLTPENEEEFGNDKVDILEGDMWVSGGYLNVIFQQNMPSKVKHRVSLVTRADEPLVDSDGYLNVEYRYNTYNDVTGYWGRGAVSFNLKKLEVPSDLKGVKVLINSSKNGMKEIVLTFVERSNQAPSSAATLNYAEMEVQ
ncbi:MAG: NigD-like protein [Phocaeicola sp.]